MYTYRSIQSDKTGIINLKPEYCSAKNYSFIENIYKYYVETIKMVVYFDQKYIKDSGNNI